MSGKLKEVRERISSVKSTMQITSAMKMVSAAKLRKAQQAITEMRPYSERLAKMLSNILSNLEGNMNSKLGVERPVENAAVVVVTSNRGLCGAFNSNIIKAAINKIDGDYAKHRKSGNLTIYCIGKKGYDVMKKKYSDCKINSDYVTLFSDLSFDNVSKVPNTLMQAFEEDNLDEVFVCYGRFRNAAVQYPECVQFLPVPKMEKEEISDEEKQKRADYIFEPSKEVLLDRLIPSILQTTFQKFVLENHASEHGARMTAMDKATENGGEMLRELKISYNKARQESITKEILEIVGGAAALEG